MPVSSSSSSLARPRTTAVGGSSTSLSGGGSKDDDAPAASGTRRGTTRDIWTLVKEMKAAEKKTGQPSDAPIESTLLFVGSRAAGKTSVVLRFLDRDDPPAPTVGMEYTFARRTRGGVNAVKDVAHIWEIAGGVRLSELVSIPLKETNVHTATFVVVLNLSKPAETIQTLTTLLPRLHTTTTQILARLEARGSKRPKALRQHAWRKFIGDGKDEHPDKDLLNPSLVPLLIIGTHYDVFKDMESDPRKLLTRTLRYLAHTHGASLLFTSPHDSAPSFRSLLSHHAFKTPPPRAMSTDPGRPVCVLAGQDSLAGIGAPPSVVGGDVVGAGRAKVDWEVWRRDVERVWPPVPGAGSGVDGDSGNGQDEGMEGGIEGEMRVGGEDVQTRRTDRQRVEFEKFPEPAIDALRAQKEEELRKLKLSNERKAREQAQLATAASTTSSSSTSRRKEKEKEKRTSTTNTRAADVRIPAQ